MSSDRLDERRTQDLAVALGNTDVVPHCWEQDGLGAQPAGDVGGDGAFEAMSVRYFNRHLPNARITCAWYVVDLRDRGTVNDDESHPFAIEEQVEFLITEGPAADEDFVEVGSDYEYDSSPLMYKTIEEAESARDALLARDRAENYAWTGTLNR